MISRPHGIGGSEAAAVLGMSNYMTNVQFWKILTGRKKRSFTETSFTLYGKAAEAPLIDLFLLDNPQYNLVEPVQPAKWGKYGHQFIHPDYPFLFGTVDGVLEKKGIKGILEIKTSLISSRLQRELWINKIPQHYYIQILHYLLVTGFDYAILKAQLKSTWNGELTLETKQYHIERGAVQCDIDHLLEKELKFWKQVTNDTKPALLLPAI